MESIYHIVIGLTTLLVSSVGLAVTFYHYFFFSKSQEGLAPAVARLFLSDAIIYLITLFFGIWALFDLGFNLAMNLLAIKIPILLFNIYAYYRLFLSIKSVRSEKR